ncbi:unnamed protein product [Onchocerca flexuosa]|uniref:YTH domain-containing protein n=1 Tax=Onchocerca flexuosa TaxID=387005 RepID=A0A183HAC8_9BILA|nr:unnamed protein product [Onchocerca flexuosa]
MQSREDCLSDWDTKTTDQFDVNNIMIDYLIKDRRNSEKEAKELIARKWGKNRRAIKNFACRYTVKSKYFLTKIKKENHCFQIVSFGAETVITQIVPTFKVKRQIYHKIVSLLPLLDGQRKSLQLCFINDNSDEFNDMKSATASRKKQFNTKWQLLESAINSNQEILFFISETEIADISIQHSSGNSGYPLYRRSAEDNARKYLSSNEDDGEFFHFSYMNEVRVVAHLAVHLENVQRVYFTAANVQQIALNPRLQR